MARQQSADFGGLRSKKGVEIVERRRWGRPFGLRGPVCFSFARLRARKMAFAGDFTPVLAKHSKSFSLIDCISVGVDRMQRNFEPMRKQVEAW